jgi:hypothetical protein
MIRKSEDLPGRLSVHFADESALKIGSEDKKGHPRIESLIGPGIFVFPDRPFYFFQPVILVGDR